MTAISDTAFDLFAEGFMSDEDYGYPHDVVFVAEDLPNVDAVLWHTLHNEHRSTVIVTGEDTEILITPCHRSLAATLIDQLLGRLTVQVAWRHHRLASPYVVRTRVGRHPLAGMRRSAVCA